MSNTTERKIKASIRSVLALTLLQWTQNQVVEKYLMSQIATFSFGAAVALVWPPRHDSRHSH
jgi:hypothetical protein